MTAMSMIFFAGSVLGAVVAFAGTVITTWNAGCNRPDHSGVRMLFAGLASFVGGSLAPGLLKLISGGDSGPYRTAAPLWKSAAGIGIFLLLLAAVTWCTCVWTADRTETAEASGKPVAPESTMTPELPVVADVATLLADAERRAGRYDGPFNSRERQRLIQAREALRIIDNPGSSDFQRQSAYRRLWDELDGLLDVPKPAWLAIEDKVKPGDLGKNWSGRVTDVADLGPVLGADDTGGIRLDGTNQAGEGEFGRVVDQQV